VAAELEDAGATGLGVADASTAFNAFFGSHHAGVVRAVYLVVGRRDVAEDIAQEAFLVAWRHWSRVSSYERGDLWVRRVAVRLAIRHAGRPRLVARAPQESDLVRSAEETDVDLLRQVSALPPAQRAAIVLFYFEDRPVAEVAEVMGCAAATARVHLHRARATLALEYQEASR
jgi:RNA polymerase sigma-70 factor (ECF subfamily)